jgi:hypothetical protein
MSEDSEDPENCAQNGHPRVRQLYGVPLCYCEWERLPAAQRRLAAAERLNKCSNPDPEADCAVACRWHLTYQVSSLERQHAAAEARFERQEQEWREAAARFRRERDEALARETRLREALNEIAHHGFVAPDGSYVVDSNPVEVAQRALAESPGRAVGQNPLSMKDQLKEAAQRGSDAGTTGVNWSRKEEKDALEKED